MKIILILVLSLSLTACVEAMAVVAAATTVVQTVSMLKKGYCEFMPNTQAIAIQRIREVEPDWKPICGEEPSGN